MKSGAVPYVAPLEMLVLRTAVSDGGTVDLSGEHVRPDWDGHYTAAARRLTEKGLGRFLPEMPFECATFQINDAGREAAK